MKHVTTKQIAVILAICAVALMVAGFLVPPMGVIDGSVLKGAGILFAFNTLFLVWHGVDKGWGATLTHGDTTVTINKDDDGKE